MSDLSIIICYDCAVAYLRCSTQHTAKINRLPSAVNRRSKHECKSSPWKGDVERGTVRRVRKI
eukprot:5145-Heterococcus_DN1.PRE.2